jgi:predicted metal-dependent phosphoesterase TrpH
MTIDAISLLSAEACTTKVRHIQHILAQVTPGDALHILTILADNSLHRIRLEEERRRFGALFIKRIAVTRRTEGVL